MTVIVCKGCGQTMPAVDIDGKPFCFICSGLNPDSGIPVEVELPETIKCRDCDKVWKVEDVLKQWIGIPFYDSCNQTFYDGCRGWS